jgi:hypothetical protein
LFWRFRERRGIGDALRALCTRQGVDDEGRRAHQSLVHGPSGLDGDELLHEGLVQAAAQLAERGGEHAMGLRRLEVVLASATSVHDRAGGAHPVTDGLIGGAPCMLEPLQGHQDTHGHGPSAARGCFGESVVDTRLDGVDQGGPGKRIGPRTEGIAWRDEVGDVYRGAGTAYPMLQRANKTHRGLSSCKGDESHRIR